MICNISISYLSHDVCMTMMNSMMMCLFELFANDAHWHAALPENSFVICITNTIKCIQMLQIRYNKYCSCKKYNGRIWQELILLWRIWDGCSGPCTLRLDGLIPAIQYDSIWSSIKPTLWSFTMLSFTSQEIR